MIPSLRTVTEAAPQQTESIVEETKKFEIAKSWKKFARIGTIGTSELATINSGGNICSKNVSLAHANNVVYLNGINWVYNLFLRSSIILGLFPLK